ADDPGARGAFAQPGPAAAQQTAAADGHHHRAHLPAVLGAQLVRGLERDGALTGHDHRMVEGRDQGRAGAVRVLCGGLGGVVEGLAHQLELHMVSADRGDPVPFLAGRGARDVDPAVDAARAAGAGGATPGRPLARIEGGEEQVRAAQLVGAHGLEVLALEPDRHPGEGGQARAQLERGAAQDGLEPLRSGLDFGGMDRQVLELGSGQIRDRTGHEAFSGWCESGWGEETGGVTGREADGDAGEGPTGMTSAVASAATPSPRPVRPNASVVLPETVTSAPAASDITAHASSRRRESRGRFPTTCTETLPISKPTARTRRAASARRRAPEAPAHSGWSTPKWVPRSPIPAAENSASQAAWQATSASECPARPGPSPSQRSPAPHSSRPASTGAKAGTS